MKNAHIPVIVSFTVAGIIAYMHDKHIWPLNSIVNEGIAAIVCIILLMLLCKGGKV